ncbi:MAG TPA: glycosyl hydrolase [Dehalococcoidia bacterium]|nr:glycosyl hydrolase [Dehalococcoidia bacterium]
MRFRPPPSIGLPARRLRSLLQGIGPLLCLAAVLLPGCASHPAPAASITPTPAGPRLEPASGAYFGVNLDFGNDSAAAFNERIGHKAAVYVQFVQFPLDAAATKTLDDFIAQVKSQHGMGMITLEPNNGLDTVTPDAATDLAERAAAYNAEGVPLFIRFAHEMNGSWYAWSQQPAAYASAFRLVAEAVHKAASQTAMVWAPNYGGGYPFAGGLYEAKPGSPDFAVLDTNHDGQLSMADDPYLPYYPGDDAVDWVGMSVYHWGNQYPWLENEVPEPGKFLAIITGNYNGLNGDERAVPDFYTVYAAGHHKPMAITETAALYNTTRPDDAELAIKQAWWDQVFAPDVAKDYPQIKMINWFEWRKSETEVGGATIDWRATSTPALTQAFRAALPAWLVFAK